jgi:putative SOS response-associated peptidase YedK
MSQFGDEGARPSGLQLVYRRDPETGLPVEGRIRWGLIPHYADTRPDLQRIHARAETISEKRMFRVSYRRRRCIVPMNSFFQKDASGKRYAISRRDGAPFGVAGIWENWRDPLTSIWERTFAVITVPANALIAPIHDRMLAILPNEQFPRRLSDDLRSESGPVVDLKNHAHSGRIHGLIGRFVIQTFVGSSGTGEMACRWMLAPTGTRIFR